MNGSPINDRRPGYVHEWRTDIVFGIHCGCVRCHQSPGKFPNARNFLRARTISTARLYCQINCLSLFQACIMYLGNGEKNNFNPNYWIGKSRVNPWPFRTANHAVDIYRNPWTSDAIFGRPSIFSQSTSSACAYLAHKIPFTNVIIDEMNLWI